MKERENPQCLSALGSKVMKKTKAKSKHGGKRHGAGRKPMGTVPGRQLPWRIPGERYAATIEAVKAHAAASGRPPGIVIADAVAMLPR